MNDALQAAKALQARRAREIVLGWIACYGQLLRADIPACASEHRVAERLIQEQLAQLQREHLVVYDYAPTALVTYGLVGRDVPWHHWWELAIQREVVNDGELGGDGGSIEWEPVRGGEGDLALFV